MLLRAILTVWTWLLVYGAGSEARKEQQEGGKSQYGRYSEQTLLEGWKNTLIPSYIAWIIFEMPILLSGVICYSMFKHPMFPHRSQVVLLFIFHYIIRTLVYPFLLRNGKPWRAGTVAVAVAFNLSFAPIQPYSMRRGCKLKIDNMVYGPDIPHWEYNPLRLLGLIIFIGGFASNQYCDYILRNLRKGPDDNGYYIPRGFLFEYVTGANFFCEFVEWLGYALFAGNLVSLGYAMMTFGNTANRATAHHNWYLEKFKEEYPKDRKIYIPFVF